MRVLGKTSGKWQDCSVVSVNGETRFQVTGACGGRKFDLTLEQLMECTTKLDLLSCTKEETDTLKAEIRRYKRGTTH